MPHGWKAPQDALPLAEGSVMVAEVATGSICFSANRNNAVYRIRSLR